MNALSRDHAHSPAASARAEDERGLLPDTDGLRPEIVMLVVNDGWDIRALKEAHSLAAAGRPVALVGRQSDPDALDRFVDDHDIDMLTVPVIRNGETMRQLLEGGSWDRMSRYERFLSAVLIELLCWTNFSLTPRKVPPPVHGALLERIAAATPRKRRAPQSSGRNPLMWSLLRWLRGGDGRSAGAETSGSFAASPARAVAALALAPVFVLAGLYAALRKCTAWATARVLRTRTKLLSPFRFLARLWQLVGRRIYAYARFFLLTIEYGETVARLKPRVIHAHDLYTLQAAQRIARWTGASVVYDAHELEADRRHGIDPAMKRWIIRQEKKYAPQAAACLTVSQQIADEMASALGIPRPEVVFNAPVTADVPGGWAGRTLRGTLGLDRATPLFVFVGKVYDIFNNNQRVGLIIEAVAQCPGYHLAIMGPIGPVAAGQIDELSARLGLGTRLHLLPPIPAEAIVGFIADADAGVYFMWPDTRNIDFSMPNKLFEFSLSGLPIVVSELTSTRWFAERARNAVLVGEKTPEAVARACRTAYESAATLRPSPARLAELRAEFSWEAQGIKLCRLYEQLLGRVEDPVTVRGSRHGDGVASGLSVPAS